MESERLLHLLNKSSKLIATNSMKYLLTLLTFLIGCNIVSAQNLIESRQTSYYTYIFKLDENAIFCENLSVGDYEFTIELIPRYSGTYTMNPAKVEMM